jgi:DNA-binding transcriptional regulator YhcF (GntR family)
MLAGAPAAHPAGVQRWGVTPLTRGSGVDTAARHCLTSRVTELDVAVDPTSHEPPYLQLRAQVEALVRSGRLVPGDRLPTVRALAADLGLAANTVARVYKELESAGLVETRGRAGTVVASGEHAAAAALDVLAARFVAAAREAGVGDAAAVEIVRRAQRNS